MIDGNISDIWLGLGGLAVTYILLVSIVCWFIIGSKGKWWLKIVITGLALWFGLTFTYSVNNFMGWPTLEELGDKKAQIIYFQIREPSKKANDEGAIFVWLRLMKVKEEPRGLNIIEAMNPRIWFRYTDLRAPRSYKLPYSKEMHKKLNEMQDAKEKRGNMGFLQKKIEGKDKTDRTDQNSRSERLDVISIAPEKLIPKNSN